MTPQDLYTPIGKEYELLKQSIDTKDLSYILSLALKVHALVHPKEISQSNENTIADYVLEYMLKGDNKTLLVPRMDCGVDLNWAGTDRVPMCWHFWHTYRIEDLVSNILVADCNQIFNDEYRKSINASIIDTGNALEFDEAVSFGKAINVAALKDYMFAVGKNTRKIISRLTLKDLQKKAEKHQLQRIFDEGGLTDDKRSKWLIDYWGGLTVFEMILTPFTDHHMMHLPPCLNNLPIL